MMDINEIIKRVKRIEIKSRRKASDLFMGEYNSSFKGRGMIFLEIRPYQYGDDVRNIDWNKTARYDEVFVKIFEEEREQTLFLMVDISASEFYGTRKQIKLETIAEICATLAFSAITYNDRVGLILYSDRVEKFIPPKKGKQHVLRIIRELITTEAKSKQTNLSNSLEELMKKVKKRTNIFIFSDFIDASDYEKNIRVLAKKHQLTGVRIYDEKEGEFPDVGMLNIQDNETGEIRLINTSSPEVRKMYKQYYLDLDKRFEGIFQKNQSGHLKIRNDEDYVKPLLNYFKSHKNR